MYARVTLLEIDTLRTGMDAALAMYRDDVLPVLRGQPGYEGVVVLATPEGKGVIISFWDTPEAAEAGGTTGFYPEVLERYLTLFRAPPGRERYEVMLAELPQSAPS